MKLTNDSLDPAESDFSSVVNKVVAAKPDAIFFGGYYAAGGMLLKQLRDKGVKAKFLSGDGSLDKGLIDGAGAANAEGALVGCPCYIATPDVTDAKVKAFADAYKAAYSADPAIYAAEGYDAATVFIDAIKAGNTPLTRSTPSSARLTSRVSRSRSSSRPTVRSRRRTSTSTRSRMARSACLARPPRPSWAEPGA